LSDRDDQRERRSIGADFENVCFDIFSNIGDVAWPRHDQQFDFVVTTPDDGPGPVEVKIYRSERLPDRVLIRMLEQVERARERLEARIGYLAVSSQVHPRVAVAVSEYFPHVKIYGYDELARLVAGHPVLRERFETILRRILDVTPDSLPEPRAVPGVSFLVEPEAVADQALAGAKLCAEARQVKKGRAGYAAFERICVDALRLMFASDFSYFRPQHPQGDKLRRDVVAKLKPVDAFWKSLVSDFRARYIVFEFKNYSSAITQAEVHTTERYLYTTALRSVAIIIARSGADKGAMRAARGALREAGKLILILSLDDLCEMLHAFDRIEDPVSILAQKADDMLMELAR